MIKVGFATVVYSEAYNYVDDYINSINNQDYDDFDLLLLNDNLSAYQHEFIDKHINKNIEWIDKGDCKSIQELRIQLIIESKNRGYDLLILGDFDDIFSLDRVSYIVSSFDSDFSFFYNDLYYLSNNKLFFSHLPLVVDEIEYILESNFLGLSNTALNLNYIEDNLLEQLKIKQTPAFDWMLYTLILLYGGKGKKINNCKTYYRIHNNNTAGDIKISDEGLFKEISIKILHYENLSNINSVFKELLEQYIIYREEFSFYRKIFYEYSNNRNNYWWGNIDKLDIARRENNANRNARN